MTFTELAQTDGPPRDRWGRYLITPTDGGKPVGHQRATTFAKLLADDSALSRWRQRMTATGLAARPDLLAAVAAADGDKKQVDGLCERALEAAAAYSGRDLGTTLHSWTEQVDRGETPAIPPPHDATIDAYRQTMAAHRVAVVDGMIERIVVHPELVVAGTFDRVVTIPGYPLPMVADVKTAQTIAYGAGEWAIQLALYATAATLWDPATGIHTPMPDVDREHALIIHLPSNGTTCTLHLLDIGAGVAMLPTAATVRDWRKQSRKLVTPLELEQPAGLEQPKRLVVDVAAANIDRRAWLRDRAAAYADLHTVGRLVECWPEGIATFGETTAHTDLELDAIAIMLDGLEAEQQMPFPPVDPSVILSNDRAVAELKRRHAALPADIACDIDAPSGTTTAADVAEWEHDIVLGELWLTNRQATVRDLLAILPVPVPVNVDAPTMKEEFWLSDLVDAWQLGILDDLLTPTADALTRLVNQYGNKSTLLAAAKNQATDLGLPRPTSTDQIAASTPLVARLAVTDA